MLIRPYLDHQRGIDNADPARVLRLHLFKPIPLMLNDRRMDEPVQPGSSLRVVENDFTETFSIDGTVRLEDVFTEGFHDRLIYRFAGSKELMGDLVRVDKVAAKFDKHKTYRALTCSDPTGKPDAEHSQSSPHACCFERILHEHCDGHRANSAGN